MTTPIGGPGDPVARSTLGFLEGQGVAVVLVDTSTEDPFLDADSLLPGRDLTGEDAVIALGAPSATALAIALLHDLPLTMAGVIDGDRLRAIDAAIDTRSVMHRSVLDIEVDGVRRLSLADVEVAAPTIITARLSQESGERIVEGTKIRMGSERPHSGRLAVRTGDRRVHSASSLDVDAAPAQTRVAINGREQALRRFSVRVHPAPLRELVLGAQGGRGR